MDGKHVDRRIAVLARVQHGVVARRQLVGLGLGRGAIERRIATGRLHRIHTGVYAVGHDCVGPPGRWLAAVLACGTGAAQAAASAAALWELRLTAATRPDVIVPVAGGRCRPGIRIIRSPGLRANEVTVRDGIPVTTVARTCLDLAGRIRGRQLVWVLDQAEVERRLDLSAMHAVLAAHRGHPGAGALRRALAELDDQPALTRSDLEARFLALCAAGGLPRPEVNQRRPDLPLELTPDFAFPASRLLVEIDSARWHLTRARWEQDHERDRVTTLAGYRTLRFTDRQLDRDGNGVFAAVRAALGIA